jgi:hypothetical protein
MERTPAGMQVTGHQKQALQAMQEQLPGEIRENRIIFPGSCPAGRHPGYAGCVNNFRKVQ